MTENNQRIRELQQMLRKAHGAAVKSIDYLATLGHRGKNHPITVQKVVHYLSEHLEEHAIGLIAPRRLIGQYK